MKTLAFSLFFFVLGNPAFGQQDPIQTQFWNHYAQFNPAMTGFQYDHFAAVAYRSYLTNESSDPKEFFAGYNTRFSGHGLGVNYSYDHIGFNTLSAAHLNYNYQLRVSRTQRISFGVAAGIKHFSTTPVWIYPNSPDPYVAMPYTDVQPNFNTGVAYVGKHLYGGIAVTNLFKPHFSEEGNPYSYTNERHYYAHAAYVFEIGEKENLIIQPQVLIRSDFVFSALDVNVLFKLYRKYWAAVGTRSRDLLTFTAGWDIKERYRIGYSYDMSLSQLTTIWRGRHEFNLGFLMNNKPKNLHLQGTPDF